MEMDETYHQKFAARINFEKMDPSLALCFLCKTRTEFDELCAKLKSDIISTGSQPLFEITETSQTPWRSCPASTTAQSQHYARPDLTANSIGWYFSNKIYSFIFGILFSSRFFFCYFQHQIQHQNTTQTILKKISNSYCEK